jgi:excisionase family DNA binding protein
MSIEADPSEGLLNIHDVAKILKVSAATIRRLQQGRKIPFVKVGGSVRFTIGDVASYVNARRVPSID